MHHKHLLKLLLTVLRQSFQYNFYFAHFFILILVHSSTRINLICLFMIFWRLQFIIELWLVYGQLVQIFFQFSFFTLSYIVNAALILIAIVEITWGNVGRSTGRTLQMNVLHLRIVLLVLILEILIGLHLVVYLDIIMICELYLLLLKWLLELERLWSCPPVLIDGAYGRWKAYFAAIFYLGWIARIKVLAHQCILLKLWGSWALLYLAVIILKISWIINILFLLKYLLVFNHWAGIIFKILCELLGLLTLIIHFIWIKHLILILFLRVLLVK